VTTARLPQRTQTCGELTVAHVGQQATLVGWVHRRRDHGTLCFIDLRDRAGLTQVVFNTQAPALSAEMVKSLRAEFLIAVSGDVKQRPPAMANPKLATGQVEVSATALQILTASDTPPFPIDEETELSEEVRLTYRYLELRRPANFERLRLRHRLIKALRDQLDAHGFLEVETPMLTRSTPEGARDYLVPSRLTPGKFFALPQSPQLFKQLLMVAGIERYFQIARCFRDEDLRSDRQPEFTQLDLEMSFLEEDDLFRLMEQVLTAALKTSCGLTMATPFPRLTHRESQEQYGTDKPDLRTDAERRAPSAALHCCWVTEFPLLKYNAEAKRWEAEHHPFTAPHPEDMDLLEREPGRVRSRAFDLVVNGIELGSGSIRIHEPALQQRVFRVLGMSDADTERRFGFLLKAFTFGAPPHGGLALGVDRLIALVAGRESIRDVIAFPKTQRAACPLTGAPAAVDPQQLHELQLRLITTASCT